MKFSAREPHDIEPGIGPAPNVGLRLSADCGAHRRKGPSCSARPTNGTDRVNGTGGLQMAQLSRGGAALTARAMSGFVRFARW